MLNFSVRWWTCSMWRMLLPCGKLVGLLFCLVLFLLSILFFSRTEFARPIMGTIFLVVIPWF